MATPATELSASRAGAEDPCVSALEEMKTLMAERQSYFHRIAFRRLNNFADAEDAVQNAFLNAWKHVDNFKGQARMSTWLTVIVMNSARMVARKRPGAPHLSLEGHDQNEENLRLSDILPDSRPDPEEQVCRRELETRLNRLSVHLAPNLREILRLRGTEGLSIRETADALGLTESAVKTRAARARAKLRDLDQRSPARGMERRHPRSRGRMPAPVQIS